MKASDFHDITRPVSHLSIIRAYIVLVSLALALQSSLCNQPRVWRLNGLLETRFEMKVKPGASESHDQCHLLNRHRLERLEILNLKLGPIYRIVFKEADLRTSWLTKVCCWEASLPPIHVQTRRPGVVWSVAKISDSFQV